MISNIIHDSVAANVFRKLTRRKESIRFDILDKQAYELEKHQTDIPTDPSPNNVVAHQSSSNIRDDQPADRSKKQPLLCDWIDDDDPDNPRNWPRAKKLFVVANVAACSFVVYGTAPIWTPSEDSFIAEYGSNHAYTSMGLSLFV